MLHCKAFHTQGAELGAGTDTFNVCPDKPAAQQAHPTGDDPRPDQLWVVEQHADQQSERVEIQQCVGGRILDKLQFRHPHIFKAVAVARSRWRHPDLAGPKRCTAPVEFAVSVASFELPAGRETDESRSLS
jgi:hypothetical protein